MGDARIEVRPTIDRSWLERALESDPVTHAYALWDLVRFPDRVRFVSAVRERDTLGYLLVWLGRPARPVVHWFGPLPDASVLAGSLPAPPLIAVVPEEVRPLAAGPGGAAHPVLLLLRPRGAPAARHAPGEVRRLTRDDRTALEAWAARGADPVVSEYAAGDPDAVPVWGAFDGDRPVAIAAASVRLPTIWIVTGVYADPSARRLGFGRAAVSAVVGAAETAGARVGLYVREDSVPARGLYEGLGFRPVARRWWLERDAERGAG